MNEVGYIIKDLCRNVTLKFNSLTYDDPGFECPLWTLTGFDHSIEECPECLDHYEEMIYASKFRVE